MRLPLALIPFTIRLHKPLVTAKGTILDRPGWLVDVGGARGEAAPLPGFGGETPEACATILDRLRNRGVESDGPGDDLGDLESELVETPCARAAIAGAISEWRARRAGVDLARWWNPRAADRVLVNGLGEDARTPVVKLKVGGDPVVEADRVRSLAGRAQVRVDANGVWTADQAERFLDRCGPLDLFEDPLAIDDPELPRIVARAPVALDAAIRAASDVNRAAGCAAVVLKPAWIGGWTPTQAATIRARALGLRVVVSSGMESSVGLRHALRIAAAVDPDCTEHHGLGTACWLVEPDAELLPVGGWVRLR